MTAFFLLVDLACIYGLFTTIKDSQQRLRSFGYAVSAFVLVLALGFGATFLLMPAHANVIDTNEVLDKVGRAISIAAPIAAVWAASIPPRRGKA